MNSHRNLLIGAATNWLAFFATLATAFFLAPYLIRKLGDGPYGVWVFLESILAYFTLFDLGIAACVVRFVAKFRTTGQTDELNRLVSTAFFLFVGLGATVFFVGTGLTFLVVDSLSQKAAVPREELLLFCLLMFGNLAVTLPLSVFPAILDGVERFAAKSLVRIGFLAIRTVGIVMLVERSPSLGDLGIWFAATNLLEHLVLAVLAFWSIGGMRLSVRSMDRHSLRRVRGYSLNAFTAMIAGRISVQSGPILIAAFLTVPQVTWFAVASRLTEFAKALLRSATNTLTPRISSLEAGGDPDAIRNLFLQASRWTLYLILPLQIGLVVFGKPFLALWLGSEDYVRVSYPALVILSSTLSLVVAQSVASRVCYGTGMLTGFVKLAILEAALSLILSVILMGPFGIEGIALGMAVGNGVFCVLVIRLVLSSLSIPIATYLARVWTRPLICAAISLAIWLAIGTETRSWLLLALVGLAGLLPHFAAVAIWELRGRRVHPPAAAISNV